MSAFLITHRDVGSIEEPENNLRMRKLISRDRHGEALSLTWVGMDGPHRPLRCDATDRVYYIIDGSGHFTLIGKESFPVGSGDTVWIPRGQAYSFEGQLEYLVINGPAFIEGSDNYLD